VTPTVIEIDRLPLTFVVTPSAGSELAWRRARDALRTELPVALGSAIEGALPDDDAYVFIDRLDVTCAIRSDWAPEVTASAFADPLARGLTTAQAGEGVLVFRDRAEFLSALLGALVTTGAGTQWWFAEFDGLRPLPISAAVRTVVVHEGDAGWRALGRLTPDLLRQVALTLDRLDAAAMVDSLPAGPPRRDVSQLFSVLRGVAADSLPGIEHRVLIALVGLLGSPAHPTSAGDAAALGALAALVDAGMNGRLTTAESSAATIAAWCDSVGIDALVRAALLALEPSEVVAGVLEEMPAGTFSPEAEGGPPSDTAFTSQGGAVLLAVVLVRMGRWHEWRARLEQVASAEHVDAIASRVALRVVARALDPRRPSRVEQDPVLRRIFDCGAPEPHRGTRVPDAVWAALGVEVGERRRSASSWLRAEARELLAAFARVVPGCEGSSPSYLRTRLLSMPASVSGDGSFAQLGRPALDVLLRLSGLHRAVVILPDGRRLALSEDLGR
jgi:hypothetical protein